LHFITYNISAGQNLYSMLLLQVCAAVVLAPGWSWQQHDSSSTSSSSSSSSQVASVMGQGSPAHVNPVQKVEPSAGVVTSSSRVVTLEQLQQHCRQAGLSGFKVPRLAVRLQQLPVNSTGKVVKGLVRQVLAAELLGKDNNVARSKL
jgi:acyl-CoA synthetase (AMP-forming)/AMP-acid ligase II